MFFLLFDKIIPDDNNVEPLPKMNEHNDMSVC